MVNYIVLEQFCSTNVVKDTLYKYKMFVLEFVMRHTDPRNNSEKQIQSCPLQGFFFADNYLTFPKLRNIKFTSLLRKKTGVPVFVIWRPYANLTEES